MDIDGGGLFAPEPQMEEPDMARKKHPKTIAAILRRDSSLWEIGDALREECIDSSREELERVQEEAEEHNVFDYEVSYLAKLLQTAKNFPRRSRNSSISWTAHFRAGSPEMLEAIVRATPKRQEITQDYVDTARALIEQKQAEKARISEPDKPLPPRRRDAPKVTLTQKEVRNIGLAFQAEILSQTSVVSRCSLDIDRVTKWVDENLVKLEGDAVDHLVECLLTLSAKATNCSNVARKLQANRRSHISLVAGE